MARGQGRPQSDDTRDTTTEDLMPSTNGSQITLLPFLRNLDGNSQTLEAEQVYYLILGAAMASSNKTAVYTIKHSILLVTGCITKEKYGLLKLVPTDGFTALYSKAAIASIASGSPIPDTSVLRTLPPAPTDTDLADNHIVAPDRLMLVDLRLKGTVLKMITSFGRRRHYMQAVGPSGIELLTKLNADSLLADSNASTLKPHTAEGSRRKLLRL